MQEYDFLGKLRPIEDSELEMMLSWRNAPEVRENMYTTDIISLENHLKWYDGIRNNKKMCYLMYVDTMNTPLGIVAFTDMNFKNKTSFWAFYAAPYAPTGTGSKMEFLALEYIFNHLNFHKLNCEVLEFNQSVVKLHKKFGFIEEGYFRQQHIHNEQYTGIYRLGLLKEEWINHRNNMALLLEKLYNR